MPNATDIVYVRRDDPVETVRILSQEKTPNGLITYEFVTPVSARGNSYRIPGNDFHAVYENVQRKEVRLDPQRPTSTGTKEEWRDYALWLEREYGHVHVEPLPRTPVPSNWGADPDTLGPVGRKARA